MFKSRIISPHLLTSHYNKQNALISTLSPELFSTAKSHGELGPTLGLRKSSSLESLQSAVQEVSMEEDGTHYWKPPNRGMVRGRGCNESFRAAVDRSYENSGMLSLAEAMEPCE